MTRHKREVQVMWDGVRKGSPNRLRRLAYAAAGVAVMALVLSNVGAATPGDLAPRFVRPPFGTHVPASTQHLYVSDDWKNVVYEFPLVNGIPSSQPDVTLTGFTGPEGVAIGPDGEIYVANAGGSTDSIFVFAPGSRTGARPVRVLKLDDFPTHLLVDSANYLYVIVHSTYVQVFAPFVRGRAKPLQEFPISGGALDFALGAGGRLFVLPNIYPVYVFRDPIGDPDVIERYYPTQYENLFAWVLAVGGGKLYVRYEPLGQGRFVDSDFAVMDLRDGDARTTRFIHTKACHEPRGYGSTTAITVVGRYLYQACHTPEAIFVFDALRSGRQQPISSLSGMFISPFDVQVGP